MPGDSGDGGPASDLTCQLPIRQTDGCIVGLKEMFGIDRISHPETVVKTVDYLVLVKQHVGVSFVLGTPPNRSSTKDAPRMFDINAIQVIKQRVLRQAWTCCFCQKASVGAL